MLAAWGFLLTGICFAVFAATFESFIIRKTKLELKQFAYAYYCLALALVSWSVAAALGDTEWLNRLVIVGDGFLLAGTLFMFYLLVGEKNRSSVWLAGLVAILLMIARIYSFESSPYMKDGILIFNSQTPVALALVGVFLLIWLPVNLRTAKLVAGSINEKSIAPLYSYIYIAATISTLIFIASHRLLTVVLSFTAIGICFLMLLASNILVEVIEDGHAAPSRAKPIPNHKP